MLRSRSVLAAFVALAALAGCTGILGSFEVGPGGPDGGGTDSGTDSTSTTDTGTSDTGPAPLQLTVKKDGLGQGVINSVPGGINCGTMCNASFPKGTTIALTATPVAPSLFGGWAGACNGKADCLITLDQAKDVTATFNQPGHKVTIRKTGDGNGVVYSTPTGITCGPNCDGEFPTNTAIKLTANPGGGSAFIAWNTGSAGACTDGQLSCDITVTGPITIEAEFAKPVTWDKAWNTGATYTAGDLAVTAPAPRTKSVRTTRGRDVGKFYWEIKATAGVATNNNGGLGILDDGAPNDSYIGQQPNGFSFGYGSANTIYYFNWGAATATGAPPPQSNIAAGVLYMFAVELAPGGHKLWVGQGGTWYNGGDPATGANPALAGFTGKIYPGISFYNDIPAGAPTPNAFTANFGQNSFAFPAVVPAGFKRGFY